MYALALALALAPLLFTSSLSLSLLSQIVIAIIVCLSYNLLLGQGGMVSFGHAVYSGMGAFLAMHTLNLVSAGLALPVSLVPLAGGVAGALLAVLLGWVSTRHTGTAFAMITFGLGELVWALALMFPGFFGGEGGLAGNRVAGSTPLGISFGAQCQLYGLIAVYTLVCTLALYAWTRTPLGRLLNAVRDNPQRVAFLGYNPHRVRYMAFVVAAFFAGIAGGLSALHYEIVSTEVLGGYRSGVILLFTFMGGSTFFFGPVIGAVLMVLAFGLLPGLTPAWLLYLGCVFVAMVMLAPGGVAGLLAGLWRQARQGMLRQLWRYDLLLATSGLIAAGSFSAWVEMAYRLQDSSTPGATLVLLGWPLDAHDPASWLLPALLGGAAVLLFQTTQRRRLKRWQAIVQPGERV